MKRGRIIAFVTFHEGACPAPKGVCVCGATEQAVDTMFERVTGSDMKENIRRARRAVAAAAIDTAEAA